MLRPPPTSTLFPYTTLSEGMRSTRLAVTPKQRIFVRLDKDQGDGMISFEVFQQRRQLFELQALARIHKQCRARKVAFAGRMKFRKDRDEVNRKVVHTIEAHVLESAEHGAFS